MAIGIKHDLYAGMTKSFLDYFGVNALSEHQGGMRVSGIVQPDSMQPDAAGQLYPVVGNGIWQKRLAVKLREYKVFLLQNCP